MVHMTSLYPQQDGVLRLYGSVWQYADKDGGYFQEVPRAPRYRAVCGPGSSDSGWDTLEWDAAEPGSEVIRDLIFRVE